MEFLWLLVLVPLFACSQAWLWYHHTKAQLSAKQFCVQFGMYIMGVYTGGQFFLLLCGLFPWTEEEFDYKCTGSALCTLVFFATSIPFLWQQANEYIAGEQLIINRMNNIRPPE